MKQKGKYTCLKETMGLASLAYLSDNARAVRTFKALEIN
jgi:hypothetical protein